jgi:hypothetical protein
MNCWGIRIYFTKLRFSLNGGFYMELLSGHEKIITKSGISLNGGTLNRGFTVFVVLVIYFSKHTSDLHIRITFRVLLLKRLETDKRELKDIWVAVSSC